MTTSEHEPPCDVDQPKQAASTGHGGKGEQVDFPGFPAWPTKRQTSVYPARPVSNL